MTVFSVQRFMFSFKPSYISVSAFLVFLTLQACKTDEKSKSEVLALSESKPMTPNVGLTNPDTFDCRTLDFGIYWYGKDNRAEKSVLGKANPFYAKDRPTVIYIHGWQKDAYKVGHRENFLFTDPTTQATQDLAAAWIDAGWNIGIFYWSQFADETEVKAAEEKIWAGDEEPLKWRRCDGTLTSEGAPKGSVARVFSRAFGEALADFEGPSLRIVGHSLGTEVAAHGTKIIVDAIDSGKLSKSLLPKRVAQLDPYWSAENKSKVWNGATVRGIIEATKSKGLIWEMYKTSSLLSFNADLNIPLVKSIGFTSYIAEFVGQDENYLVKQGLRHVWAPKLYFMSFQFAPPRVCPTKDASSCQQIARSAATSDADTRCLMDAAVVHRQLEGKKTPTTSDDTFEEIVMPFVTR